jgi:hypothetical protein
MASLVIVSGTASAQSQTPPAPRLSGPGQAWEEWRTRGGTNERAASQFGREAAERANAVREARRAGVASALGRVDTEAARVAAALGSADEVAETLQQLEEIATSQGAPRTARAAAAARRLLERSGLVDPADAAHEPREAPDGQPDVPSSCEGNPACQQCYGEAMDKLDNTRYRLERLRAIYSSTYSWAKGKIAFADGVSGFHGMSALAWQKYKIGVMQSLKNLDGNYDNKYAELMEALLDNLQGISSCEARIMNVPDWYDRFGFVYYQFMKDAYKRPAL